MLDAQLTKEDFLAYCKASSESLTEECKQLLVQARAEQWEQIFLWGGGALGIVLVFWLLQKAWKKLRARPPAGPSHKEPA